MPESPPIHDTSIRLPATTTSPTLAVWISSFFVLVHCVLNVVVGALEVARGLFNRTIPAPPDGLTPLFDPLYAGVLTLMLAGTLAYFQYSAVQKRSAVRSYVMGGLYLIWGVLVCMAPWNAEWLALHYVLAGTILFVGISMLRWGRRLSQR
jgi:hypothetical protein